jgi:hypothetical protein
VDRVNNHFIPIKKHQRGVDLKTTKGTENKESIYLLSIVAIVAIAAIAVMFMMNNNRSSFSSNKDSTTNPGMTGFTISDVVEEPQLGQPPRQTEYPCTETDEGLDPT